MDWNVIKVNYNSAILAVALLTESVDWNARLCVLGVLKSLSLSSRRAWIEIINANLNIVLIQVALLTESVDWNSATYDSKIINLCRSPHGERGLKLKFNPHRERSKLVALLTESVDWNQYKMYWEYTALSRSPHGERGLKSKNQSREINQQNRRSPHGERGLKFYPSVRTRGSRLSLSSRRAWIEIKKAKAVKRFWSCRSPHGERGLKLCHLLNLICLISSRSPHGERGLKSCKVDLQINLKGKSLSSRRAWIEICDVWERKDLWASLSSRRAWIEISVKVISKALSDSVALLTESVDWNRILSHIIKPTIKSRSPHGERGLKSFCIPYDIYNLFVSLSSRRAWIEISSAKAQPVKPTGRSPHGERGLK